MTDDRYACEFRGTVLPPTCGCCCWWKPGPSPPSRLLPELALVWTSSKLLVLDSRLVNSVKLNLLALDEDCRFSTLGRTVPSSDGRPAVTVVAAERPEVSVADAGRGGLAGPEADPWFGRLLA